MFVRLHRPHVLQVDCGRNAARGERNLPKVDRLGLVRRSCGVNRHVSEDKERRWLFTLALRREGICAVYQNAARKITRHNKASFILLRCFRSVDSHRLNQKSSRVSPGSGGGNAPKTNDKSSRKKNQLSVTGNTTYSHGPYRSATPPPFFFLFK